MTRLCGWVGFDAPADERRAVLEAMTGAPADELAERGAFWLGTGCALGVVPGATTVDTYRDDALWVAVEGPVRFEDAGLAETARTEGAAAAVARGYGERGDRVLRHVHDAFALVVLRPEVGSALLAVDRIGGRHPLTYRVAGESLVFGSSAHAVQRHPRGASEVAPQALFNYLYFHVVPGPGTARREISRLMPGHYLRFAGGSARIERYWQMVYEEHGRPRVAALEAELHRRLRASVRHDAEAEGPVGAFLSGGTDSSTVVGLLGEVTGEPPRAYSIGFDAAGYDEMRYARAAAKHFGARHREYYVRPADVVEAVPVLAAAHAEPFGNASAVPAYFCARLAREDGVRRLLGGDGGDELFAGNERYLTQQVFAVYDRVPSLVKRIVEPLAFGFPAGDKLMPVRKVRSYLRQANVPMPRRLQAYNYFERQAADQILTADFHEQVNLDAPLALLDETWDEARADSMVTRMLALDLRFTLADNDLPKVSRSGEVAGVEVTYPLLSDALVDFSRRVPPRLNLRRGKLRWFWKHALRNFLPKEVLQKSKHGFGLPFGVWMRDDPLLREMARDNLDAFKARGIVRPAYIDELLHLHATEHAAYYGVMIWLLVMLEQWFVAHVDTATSPAEG